MRPQFRLYDPTVRGPGAGTAVAFYIRFGKEFLKKLYVDQKPVLSRDGRQLADWLARGTYPISLGRLSDVKYMKEQGFPVDVLSLPGEGGTISAANGLVALLNRASPVTTFIAIIYPGKMLDPLKPVLILPEVVDPAKWKRGKLWFMDPEEKYILRLYNYVGTDITSIRVVKVRGRRGQTEGASLAFIHFKFVRNAQIFH